MWIVRNRWAFGTLVTLIGTITVSAQPGTEAALSGPTATTAPTGRQRLEQEDPARISRFVKPLEQQLRIIRKAANQIAALKDGPEPDHAKLLKHVKHLHLAGEVFRRYIAGKYANPKGGRRGTLREVQLFQQIRQVHEEAANSALELSQIKDLHGQKPATSDNSSKLRSMLKQIGKDMAEQTAIKWAERNGLDYLLVTEHKNALTGVVRKNLNLNLKKIIDRQAVRSIGMPLGGLRSFKAAFRLQARRHLRQCIRRTVLKISGNGLVLMILERNVLRWVENEFWPKLREALRPKVKLARRVDISVKTLMDSRDEMNKMVTQLANLDYRKVFRVLYRAEGRLAATKYLDRDLARADNKNLQDQMEAAKKILRRDIRRFKHQYLIADEERWETINDECAYFQANQVGLARLIERLKPVTASPLVVVFPSPAVLAKYGSRNFASFPIFTVGLNATPPGTGTPKVLAKIGSATFVLHGQKNRKGQWEFVGFLPVLPGACRIVFSCPDIPGCQPLVYTATRKQLLSDYIREKIQKKQQDVRGCAARLKSARPDDRQRALNSLLMGYTDLAALHIKAGQVPQAGKVVREGLNTAQGKAGSFEARLWYYVAIDAFRAGSAADLQKAAHRYVQAVNVQFADPKKSKQKYFLVKRKYFLFAELLLTVGAKDQAMQYYKQAEAMIRRMSRRPDSTLRSSVYRWPNLRAIVAVKKP